MTGTLARAESVGTDPHAQPRALESSRWARWRVAVRLARRQVRRTWVSSLLIATLVALPIAGMAGAAIFVDSMVGTPSERADVALGRMQAWVAPAGVPDAGFWQMPSEPHWNGYPLDASGSSVEQPEGEIPADPLSALPAGTETVYIGEGQARIETSAGLAVVPAWSGAIWDPRFSGRFDVVDGAAPANAGEVMVTAATLARAGAVIGGTITDADSGRDYTITGTIDVATLPDADSGIAFFDAERFGGTWYLPELRLDWADVQRLNEAGMIAYSRAVVLDPPEFQPEGMDGMSTPESQAAGNRWALVATLAAAGVAAGYMVVMLAGAAFAVSARRQQRALAIAASVGADARDLRRIVRLQGTVLGLVGGVLGTALGVGVAAVAIRVLDTGSATQFWGFHVPWEMLAGILVFAVLVGTGAALMPARGVARSDAMSALRGARRPQKVTASRPIWGSLMLIVGVGVTVVSGLSAAAIATSSVIPWDSPLRWLPIIGIIGGPILAQLGIVLSGRWLLWLTSLALSKVGIAARIASRDAVANGARTVPAFAAIGATVFAGVFAVGMVGMSTGLNERTWTYSAPVGTAVGTLYSRGPEALTPEQAQQAAAATVDVYREVGASATATALRQPALWAETPEDIPADLERAVAVMPDSGLIEPEEDRSFGYTELSDPDNNLTVLEVDDVEIATGIRLDAAQRSAYDRGAALVTQPALVTGGTIEIAAWSERDWQHGDVPSNSFVPWPDTAYAEPLWQQTIDAFVVTAPDQPVVVAISPRVAESLGIAVVPYVVFGAFDTPPTTDQRDRLWALSDGVQTDAYAASVWIEDGPVGAEIWIIPLLGAMAVLVVGASAVALGLARFERRPDDATLTAVGGTNGLRRRIAFWQGLVIVGFGTFAGAVAGILPPLGFFLQSQGERGREFALADIPWWVLLVLAVALPLVIAVANAVVPPRRPELTRRTAIA